MGCTVQCCGFALVCAFAAIGDDPAAETSPNPSVATVIYHPKRLAGYSLRARVFLAENIVSLIKHEHARLLLLVRNSMPRVKTRRALLWPPSCIGSFPGREKLKSPVAIHLVSSPQARASALTPLDARDTDHNSTIWNARLVLATTGLHLARRHLPWGTHPLVANLPVQWAATAARAPIAHTLLCVWWTMSPCAGMLRMTLTLVQVCSLPTTGASCCHSPSECRRGCML